MEHDWRSPALRVGLAGSAPAADVLAVLARLTPEPSGAVPLLRLLHVAAASPAVPAGWSLHPVAGDTDGAVDVIVRNADVLIVAGEPEAEWAAPVSLALELGSPVLCLASSAPARLLMERFWRVARRPPPEGEAALAALAERVRMILAPPAGALPATLQAIEANRRLPDRRIWRADRIALELLAPTPPELRGADGPVTWWMALYRPADDLARGYADRYRSSYTIVLALAAVALISAVLGLRVDARWWLAAPEAACLALIIVVVWANTRLDWRPRLIQCRLLAELCRKQAALSFLGGSLPSARIAGLMRDGELSWVGWRFATAVRSAPLPATVLVGAGLDAARDAAAATLLAGQRSYHERRIAVSRRREERLVLFGGAIFGLTVLFVLIKLGLLSAGQDDAAEISGLFAALLPAIAAALFGFRAYAELELLVQQSERLIAILDDADRSLSAIDTGRVGAAAEIGDVLEETASEMLADVEGWIQISRVKAVEAG